MKKNVFVSDCFEMPHSGHVAFFEEVATHGDLYVGIGSDRTISDLEGRRTINGECERLYMIRSLKYVRDAWTNRGWGLLDFEFERREMKRDNSLSKTLLHCLRRPRVSEESLSLIRQNPTAPRGSLGTRQSCTDWGSDTARR